MDCTNCPERIPELTEGNIKTMQFFGVAANCVRYVGTMDGVLVAGIDWVNLQALAKLNHVKITRSMMRRLGVIESLLIKESKESVKNAGK